VARDYNGQRRDCNATKPRTGIGSGPLAGLFATR